MTLCQRLSALQIACGVPVVANTLRGVYGGWIEDGENGYMCELDARLLAEKIIAATHLGEARMHLASESMLERASTEVIDSAYYERLKALAGKR